MRIAANRSPSLANGTEMYSIEKTPIKPSNNSFKKIPKRRNFKPKSSFLEMTKNPVARI